MLITLPPNRIVIKSRKLLRYYDLDKKKLIRSKIQFYPM